MQGRPQARPGIGKTKLPAVGLGDTAAQEEAEADTAGRARARCIGAPECFAELRELGLIDPGAKVAHAQF